MSEHHDDVIGRTIRSRADATAPITLEEVQARRVVVLDDALPEPDLDPERPDLIGPDTIGPDTGGPDMVIELERDVPSHAGHSPTRRGPGGPGSRWWGAIAAAAAAVVAIVVVGALVSRGGGDPSVELGPADGTTPTLGATGDLESRTAIVDGVLSAFDSGDLDAAAPLLADGFSANKLLVEEYVAANAQWERTGACREERSEAIVCPLYLVDDFHGAAGLSIDTDVVFAFEPGDPELLERVNVHTEDPWDEFLAFRAAFKTWVADAHPEVPLVYYPPPGTYSDPLADMPVAASMPAALDHVDEFVAQSSDYSS